MSKTEEALPPLYAKTTVRVRGKLYRAGDEIPNPGGSRGPLLQFGQATATPPRKRRDVDTEDESPESGHDPKSGDESPSEKKAPEDSDDKKPSKKPDDKKAPDKKSPKT
jgi:hypothetical protein